MLRQGRYQEVFQGRPKTALRRRNRETKGRSGVVLKIKRIAAAVLALALIGAAGCYVFGGPPETQAFASDVSDLISGKPQTVPAPGTVTMVDLGAHACVPCKMMIPIIQELSREYEGRAAIIFIDVWKHPDETPKYGLRAIPTQIFYDAQGVERFRHEGFMDKTSITAKLAELGAG